MPTRSHVMATPFDAQIVCVDPQHCIGGRKEELHTQFARRMETKVVVAITWIPVGIGQDGDTLIMR